MLTENLNKLKISLNYEGDSHWWNHFLSVIAKIQTVRSCCCVLQEVLQRPLKCLFCRKPQQTKTNVELRRRFSLVKPFPAVIAWIQGIRSCCCIDILLEVLQRTLKMPSFCWKPQQTDTIFELSKRFSLVEPFPFGYCPNAKNSI